MSSYLNYIFKGKVMPNKVPLEECEYWSYKQHVQWYSDREVFVRDLTDGRLACAGVLRWEELDVESTELMNGAVIFPSMPFDGIYNISYRIRYNKVILLRRGHVTEAMIWGN